MNRFLKYSGILQQQAHQVGGGEAVAPEVISVSPSIIASGTNHNVSLPATLSSGDLVFIWSSCDGGNLEDINTIVSGWSRIYVGGNGNVGMLSLIHI